MDSGYSPPMTESLMDAIPLPHPYLREPRLYISGLAPNVRKPDLAEFFAYCVPYRPVITQDEQGSTLPGYIDFKELASAEKALATLQGRTLPPPAPYCTVTLSIFPDPASQHSIPPPSALPRLVKQLPFGITDSELYDTFRPFGALANVRSEAGFGPDIGVLEYWYEEDAKRAEEAMHCADIGGQNISIQVYQPRKAPGGHNDFSASAPPFVPAMYQAQQPQQQFYHQPFPQQQPYQNYSPPRASYNNHSPSRGSPPFQPGPGQQVQYAPPSGPGSGSQSGLIDPCNLFIKNLDPTLDSNELFTQFRSFGQIVSARVMRTEGGQSRGFGFVSYQSPDQAAAALNAMNGSLLGTKQIVVRLHEPKQLRQEKLANRFSRSSHPRSSTSGATSPSPSDLVDYPGTASPPTLAERGRRSSGSYYQAALTGNLSFPMRYEELSALSPVVRKEVLTGELSRRIKTMDGVSPSEVSSLVDAIVAMNLEEVIEGIQDSEKLADQVKVARGGDISPGEGLPLNGNLNGDGPTPPSAAASTPSANQTPASAPEHPSTPVSFAPSLNDPPRTSSPSGSLVLGGASEKEKLLASVTKYEPRLAQEVTELLLSLSKKERAMCLFNPDYLRNKIAEAKLVLESNEEDEEGGDGGDGESVGTTAAATSTTATMTATVLPKTVKAPTPAVAPTPPPLAPAAKIVEPVVAPPSPPPPVVSAPVHTLASLAKLPAIEIVKLARSPNATATGLPLPKADPVVVKATDEFIDNLAGKPDSQQKQLVGEKLFKIIKAFGLRNSPKVTIALLDSEDLRSLAHLMNSYPSVLKEKVMQAAASK